MKLTIFMFMMTQFLMNRAWAGIPMAVTVDDLPVHGPTAPGESRTQIAEKFVEVLKRHNVGEAFGFVNGKGVELDPATREVLEVWTRAGYPLGNHTYSHMSLSKNSAADFLREVDDNETLLREFAPLQAPRWFRYPFLHEGNTLAKRNAVRKGLGDRGYRVAEVTVDFEDWAWNSAYVRCLGVGDQNSVERLRRTYIENALQQLRRAQIFARKLFGRPIRHVLLLHIGTFDAQMLESLLTAYESKGVEFISLAEAQADPIYGRDPRTTRGEGFTLLDQWARKRGWGRWGWPRVPPRELAKICRPKI